MFLCSVRAPAKTPTPASSERPQNASVPPRVGRNARPLSGDGDGANGDAGGSGERSSERYAASSSEKAAAVPPLSGCTCFTIPRYAARTCE